MEFKRRKKKRGSQDESVEPNKEETAVAKHLRWNCPTKSSTMMGNKVEYFIGPKRKKQQESDEEPQEDASDTSSVTGRDSAVPGDFDARSECSNTTNNDDNSSTRSDSPLVLPIIDNLPAKFKRVGSGEENRSCARTDVVFVHPEKPKVKEISKHTESSTSKCSPTKTEALETSSSREQPTTSRQSPKTIPATVTIPGYPEGAIDYRMLPYMYQQGVLPESRENAAKFTEGFEQWYASYRMAHTQDGRHYLPGYQLLGRGAEQSALASRNLTPQAQAHEAMMKNASSSRTLVLDPTTGYPVPLGSLHSHSHMHTHFHIHPLEQQQMQAQAAAAAANMEHAAYFQAQTPQHPGIV